MKIRRLLAGEVARALRAFPVVALLGPRQVGKTTLAHDLSYDRSYVVPTGDRFPVGAGIEAVSLADFVVSALFTGA